MHVHMYVGINIHTHDDDVVIFVLCALCFFFFFFFAPRSFIDQLQRNIPAAYFDLTPLLLTHIAVVVVAVVVAFIYNL